MTCWRVAVRIVGFLTKLNMKIRLIIQHPEDGYDEIEVYLEMDYIPPINMELSLPVPIEDEDDCLWVEVGGYDRFMKREGSKFVSDESPLVVFGKANIWRSSIPDWEKVIKCLSDTSS